MNEELVETLEKALFMARNGKVVSFVGMILTDKMQIEQVMHVPDEHVVTMVGMTTLMLRDIQTLCPVFEMGHGLDT